MIESHVCHMWELTTNVRVYSPEVSAQYRHWQKEEEEEEEEEEWSHQFQTNSSTPNATNNIVSLLIELDL